MEPELKKCLLTASGEHMFYDFFEMRTGEKKPMREVSNDRYDAHGFIPTKSVPKCSLCGFVNDLAVIK